VLSLLKKELKNLIYPSFCFDCGGKVLDESPFCELCTQLISEYPLPPIINSKLNPKIKVYSCFDIEIDIIKESVHDLKYNSYDKAALYLVSKRLPNFDFNDIDAVVPVPLNKKRERWRGYNQSMLLAKEIGLFIDKPVLDILIRKKNTTTQTKKNRKSRIKEMEDAFILDKKYKNSKIKTLLIIDDVYTTGATTNECAKILLESGVAQKVKIFSLGRA
jgi:ComF family protein